METFIVRSESGVYPVVCGRGALRRLAPSLARLKDFTGVFVVSSRRVWSHCGGRVAAALRGVRLARPVLFNDAESAKNLEKVGGICRELIRAGADRGCVIVAGGGGVVGDMAGVVGGGFFCGVGVGYLSLPLFW